MSAKAIVARIGSMVALPAAILVGVFFFLTWTELRNTARSQDAQLMGRATGLQLTLGRITPYSHGEVVDDEEVVKKANEAIHVRPWFGAGLLVPVLLLLFGLLGTCGVIRPSVNGILLVLFGAIGLTVVILAVCVDYSGDLIDDSIARLERGSDGRPTSLPADRRAEIKKRITAEIRKSAKTEATGVVWGSLGAYAGVIACGIASLVMGLLIRPGRVVVARAIPLHPQAPPFSQQ
jgi:hypothetical protein